MEEELKDKIYGVMVEYFGNDCPKAHAVAQDFSRTELNAFIGTYTDYLMK